MVGCLAGVRYRLGLPMVGNPEYRLMARWAILLIREAALIAGNESGRDSIAHRADLVTLPSMVQRDQRNHFPPPVLRGHSPSVRNGWGVPATSVYAIYIMLFSDICQPEPTLR